MRYIIVFALLIVSCRDESGPPMPAEETRILELRVLAAEVEVQELAKSPYRCFLLQGTPEADLSCVEFVPPNLMKASLH